MKKLQRTKLLTLFLFTLSVINTSAREATIASPDGKLVVTINDDGGSATYAVTLDGTPMLLPSALGFRADFGDFRQGLKIINTSAEAIDKQYEMRQVKQSHFHFTATQLNVDVENDKQQKMTIQFVVSDNNVAFRYVIPRQKNDNPKSAVIFEEATAFCLPDGTTTFLTPQSSAMIGWERTKPSYEEEYKADAPMTDRSKYGQGYTFPCLFKIQAPATEGVTKAPAKTAKGVHSETFWLLISETGVTSSYCGSHLSDYKAIEAPSGTEGILPPFGGTEGGAYTIAYPMPGENNGRGDTFAGITLPGSTPWRTLTVGNSLKPIVETTIQYDVVEPLYEPSEDYKSGRYTWSWLIWQDNSINWDDQVRFIDLAAAMNFEYCLVDNWWDQNIGRERMAELSKYALSKGVTLMLWYNSNGYENDAPQTPRNCMDTNIARDREMAWLKEIGVKGIKVDFFGGDKQETMRLYEEILYDANRYGLQCIFHGCTLPRGWERMYPNYVSSEAVLASENVYFTDHHAEQEPFELCMHPFCRNAVGTMDWGGVIMNRYLSKDNRSRHQRQTTDVFELASGITNQAAIQCVAMQPNNLDELPEVELEFLRQLPTTWDETRFIDGYPGRYVVLARRHGEQWYIAGLNALKEPLTLSIDLLPFSPRPTTAIIDIADKQGHISGTARQPLKVDKRGRTKITMQPNGGIVIF
ncbi:MAG: glycoside hydrolase family 97 catalytic domain-containing protein [Prevotella sp.]|nr:glycoside hydrolase family 97 catalytic domain-containing protein [Prevotella sp.]